MAEDTLSPARTTSRVWAIRSNRWVYWITNHWLLFFSLIYGLYVGLPFLAPVFMEFGLQAPARVIYTIYSFLCHQLPQRSYFLFGQTFTYPLEEIQAAWTDTANPAILRRFIGTAAMGWKVAWSDRMISLYTSILLFAWIWYPLRKRLPKLGWKGLIFLTLPMVVDGLTHMVSDFAGFGEGFRNTNAWLVPLTNGAFSPGFYMGDAWGSFNSWMRLLTGVLFGAGIAWFGFPYLEEFFGDLKARIQWKFRRAGIHL